MQKILIMGELQIPYELIISKRKSIEIKVSNEKGVEVRAPQHTSNKVLEDILKSRVPWILEKTKEIRAKADLKPSYLFKTGEKIPFMGRKHILYIHKAASPKEEQVKLDEQGIHVHTCQEDAYYIKENLTEWYKYIAKIVLTKKTSEYSRKMGVSFEKVKISSPSKRWGSCSSNGNINYNWKIILAPEQVIDYLVVHELAHRKEMNHSAKFYAILFAVLPDYAVRKKWLKDNGMYLDLS